MSKLLAAVAALGAASAILFYSFGRGPAPKQATFARAERQALASSIVTNGRIEPSEFAAVRAPREGALTRLAIEQGQRVAVGQILAEMDAADLRAEASAAEARIAQARAELALFAGGGSPAVLAEIDSELAAANVELAAAKADAAKTARLVEKQAETQDVLTAARDRVRRIETSIDGLNRRRGAQLPAGGKDAAESRRREAEAALASTQRRMEQSVVRSPLPGVVYNLPLRAGAFVRPGDLIAEVGRTGGVKAIIYVDEPELGRVAKGMRVKITWDALAGRAWEAVVEKLPAQIVPLNSRQVGEVICTIPNADGALPPGANVNAEVLSREAAGALAIPKAALRREGAQTGVLALGAGNKLEWRPVRIGISSITHVEVTAGLQEGERVVLPGETPLAAGEVVASQP